MKEDVARLRSQSDAERQELEQGTAASRLQLAHEKAVRSTVQVVPKQQAPKPSGLQDFPALGSGRPVSSSGHHDTASLPSPTVRKPSYAIAATAGMKDAIDHAFAGPQSKQADSMFSDTVSDGPLSATSANSGAGAYRPMSSASTLITTQSTDGNVTDDDGESVVVSPRSDKSSKPIAVALSIASATSSTAKRKPAKNLPHFAQPTKAFAKRAGETLRKESISPRSKAVTDGVPSPKQHQRTEAMVRAGHQQQKRKSLPCDWLGSGEQTDPNNPNGTETTILSSPLSVTAACNEGDWQLVSATNGGHIEQSKGLRKKASSYMAPTTATTRRTIATLGPENGNKQTTPTTRQLRHGDEAAELSNSSPFTSGMSHTGSSPGSSKAQSGNSKPTEALLSPAARLRKYHLQTSSDQQATDTTLNFTVNNGPAKTNSKIPRACKSSKEVPQKKSAAVATKWIGKDAAARALPDVANTTPKRVTSDADIMPPILSELDSKGLLKNNPDSAYIAHQRIGLIKTGGALHGMHEQRPKTPDIPDEATRKALADIKIMKAVPPHLKRARELQKSRESSSASDSTEATLIAVDPSERSELLRTRSQPDTGRHNSLSSNSTNVIHDTPCPTDGTSRNSSLRASAKVFTPLWKPQTIEHELRLLSWQGALDQRPQSEWSALPEHVKNSIQTLREYKRTGSQPPSFALGTRSQRVPPRDMSMTADRGFWGNAMVPPPEFATSDQQPNVSHNIVRAGQVLKPLVSPGQKTVKWTMQDFDGSEKPVGFGRAPAPAPPVFMQDVTPSISPTSDDTSPIKTPDSGYTWTIGSTATSGRYGWKGGDGKEISFAGYGPLAERDPGVPVTMGFYSRGSSTSRSPTHDRSRPSVGGENASPVPRVWPRSQRQWAEFAALSKVPCGSMDITQAVEHIPFGQTMTGYCNDCTVSQC